MFERIAVALALATILLTTVACEKPGDKLPDNVVAKLDDKDITVNAFSAFCGGDIPDTDSGKREMLNRLANKMLILDLAREKGYLSAPKISSESGKVKRKYLVEALNKEIEDSVEVGIEDLPPVPEGMGPMIDLSVIVTPTIEEAREARKMIDAGEDFGEVAKKMSTGPSAIGGGHIGSTPLNTTIYGPGVRAMLNEASEGDVTPIAKLKTGYAIFKVNNRLETADVVESYQNNQLKELRAYRINEKKALLKRRLRDENEVIYNRDYGKPGADSSWMADVNGQKISLEIPKLTEKEAMHLPHALLDDDEVKAALEKEIDNILLAKEAGRRGLDMTQEYLEASWNAELESVVQYYTEKEIWPEAKVSDQDLKDYYENNIDEFELLPKVELRRILVSDKDLAQNIKERLDEGEDFAHLAVENSQDKTAANGGYVGDIYKGRAIEPINTVAFELEPGEYSDVLKTKYGYEIIQVLNKREGGPATFESIKDKLRVKLENEKRAKLVEKFYAELFKGHTYVVNERVLDGLK